MRDQYQEFSHSLLGKKLCKLLGLPIPAYLKRATEQSDKLVDNILLGSVNENYQATQQCHSIKQILAPENIYCEDDLPENVKINGMVFDATNIKCSGDLFHLYQFFNQYLKNIAVSGKIVIIGLLPETLACHRFATAQRSLIGFIKSIAKEVGRKGITANLILTESADLQGLASTLRFFQSYRSAYVNGQVINTFEKNNNNADNTNWQLPLANKIALVTGASRGIGAQIVTTLARDGALVIGLDIPQAKAALEQTMATVNGLSLLVDVSAENSDKTIAEFIAAKVGAIDVVVHNAGITRDKMLSRMTKKLWQQVISINLSAIEDINEHLLAHKLINNNGRIIGVSSISGIAGNVGQSNYATSKAGIIGMVNSMKAQLQENNITINAVAPGFIETDMTAAIPFITRQFGRRFCSLSQAGLPIDVAETIAFFAAEPSQGVNGNVVRVCGQNILGA